MIQKPFNRKQLKPFKLPRNGSRRIRWKSMQQRWVINDEQYILAVSNELRSIKIQSRFQQIPTNYNHFTYCAFVSIFFPLCYSFFLYQAKDSSVNNAHLPLTQALINLKEQQELAESQVINWILLFFFIRKNGTIKERKVGILIDDAK